MEIQNPQSNYNPNPESQKSWFSRHMVLGYLLLFAAFAGVVGGIYRYQYGRTPSAPEQSLEQKDETASWKTYTNAQYGFEFKYPDLFSTVDGESDILVKLAKSPQDKTYQEGNLYVNFYYVADFAGKTKSINLTTPASAKTQKELELDKIASRLGTKIVPDFIGDPPWDTRAVYIQKNGTNTGISVWGNTDVTDTVEYGGNGSNLSLFKQILSTFKFIEPPVAAVVLKTYTNKEYGFEFKYPEDNYDLNAFNGEWSEVTLHDKRDRQIFNFSISVNHPGQGFEGMVTVSESKFNIGGYEAYKTILEQPDGHETGSRIALYSFAKDGNGYMVVASGSYEKADQILSTLKFAVAAVNADWVKYINTDFGFEMAIPKNGWKDDFGPGFNLSTNKEIRTAWNHLAHVIFLNDYDLQNGCDGTLEQNGWTISKAKGNFCAQKGVYRIIITFSDNNLAMNEYILSSIKLKATNTVVQPKYYLYCYGPFDTESPPCDLFTDGKLMIKNLMGKPDSVLPSLGIYSGYSILGWDDSRVVFEGGAGDACFSHRIIYEILVTTLTTKQIAESTYNCPQTPEDEAKAKIEADAYVKIKAETVEALKNLYPKINL